MTNDRKITLNASVESILGLKRTIGKITAYCGILVGETTYSVQNLGGHVSRCCQESCHPEYIINARFHHVPKSPKLNFYHIKALHS